MKSFTDPLTLQGNGWKLYFKRPLKVSRNEQQMEIDLFNYHLWKFTKKRVYGIWPKTILSLSHPSLAMWRPLHSAATPTWVSISHHFSSCPQLPVAEAKSQASVIKRRGSLLLPSPQLGTENSKFGLGIMQLWFPLPRAMWFQSKQHKNYSKIHLEELMYKNNQKNMNKNNIMLQYIIRHCKWRSNWNRIKFRNRQKSKKKFGMWEK